MRTFRDAPDWGRCGAAVRMRDGSYAQCGKWRNDEVLRGGGDILCTQHWKVPTERRIMWRDTKPNSAICDAVDAAMKGK
jgi:hypothetical protein